VSEANTYMHGGNHYRKVEGEQHWDRMWRLFGPGYFIGCATKYLERYRDKGGLQDLDKAIHFTTKLKELEQAASDGTGPLPGGGYKPLSQPLPYNSLLQRNPSDARQPVILQDGHGHGYEEGSMCAFGSHNYEVVEDYQGGRVCKHCGIHEESIDG
jgi:hypothetical protein